MSQEYAGQDPLQIAKQAERDLNSHTAKHGQDASLSSTHGHGASDSSTSFPLSRISLYQCSPLTFFSPLATESGVNQSVEKKFAGAEVTYGSAASGAGDNRTIPVSEGGDINPSTGQYVYFHTPTQDYGSSPLLFSHYAAEAGSIALKEGLLLIRRQGDQGP